MNTKWNKLTRHYHWNCYRSSVCEENNAEKPCNSIYFRLYLHMAYIHAVRWTLKKSWSGTAV